MTIPETPSALTVVAESPTLSKNADSDFKDCEEAKEVNATPAKPCWKKFILIGCAVLAAVIVIGLAVGLGVGLTRHKNDGSSDKAGNNSGTDSNGGSKAIPGKLAVYWGGKGENTTLESVCSDPSYDIVNLAFLTHFFRYAGYPRLSIGLLGGPSAAQQAVGAIALQDGTSLESSIKKCQDNGKIVLLSMGGAKDYADVRLSSDTQGQEVAEMVWNLFLGGTKNPDIRPFGNVTLDGVDFDNESGQSTGYVAMTKAFRAKFQTDAKRRYYLTAAPQCPFPDDPELLAMCKQLDYVWVQFYNNDQCNIAQSGFESSVKKWSNVIGSSKLFIGALAGDEDGDEGFVPAATLQSAIQGVEKLDLPNLGGVMLWDAQLAAQNNNYQEKVNAILGK